MFTSLDVFQSFDDESLAIISVVPTGLSRPLVVKHIGVGDESVSLHAIDIDSENTTGDHHTNLRVLLQGELAIVRHLSANQVVIGLDVDDFLGDLVLEGTALEPGTLSLSVKDGEVVERLGQDVNVLIEPRTFLFALLHDVCRQERVLG